MMVNAALVGFLDVDDDVVRTGVSLVSLQYIIICVAGQSVVSSPLSVVCHSEISNPFFIIHYQSLVILL